MLLGRRALPSQRLPSPRLLRVVGTWPRLLNLSDVDLKYAVWVA